MVPHDDYEAVLGSFIDDLNQARRKVGLPSYNELEQVSRRLRASNRDGEFKVDILARSTTQEMLAGRQRRPPKWHKVLSFLLVLRYVAKGNGIAAVSIGTNDEWRQKHDAVSVAAEYAERRSVNIGRHRKSDSVGNIGIPDPCSGLVPPQRPAVVRHADTRADSREKGILGTIPDPNAPQWWDGYRDITSEWLCSFLYLESVAKVVRTYEPVLFPGMLQTEGYARAVLARCRPDATADQITRLVELRMRRQELLRSQRLRLWAIIEGDALRNQKVDVQTMRSQLTHLINLSEEPDIALQVLLPPQSSAPEDHLSIKEPITIFRFPEEHLDDVVFIERPQGGVFLTERKVVTHYNQLVSRLGMRALAGPAVRSFLAKVFTELLHRAHQREGHLRDAFDRLAWSRDLTERQELISRTLPKAPATESSQVLGQSQK